jgi:hypothetical protein
MMRLCSAIERAAGGALATGLCALRTGDLNVIPDSAIVAPPSMGGSADVTTHSKRSTGTYSGGTARSKIGYLIMSPALQGAQQQAGVTPARVSHPTH